jgi:hypothetical protein
MTSRLFLAVIAHTARGIALLTGVLCGVGDRAATRPA